MLLVSFGTEELPVAAALALLALALENLVVALVAGGRGDDPRFANGHAAGVFLGALAGLAGGLLGGAAREAVAKRALGRAQGDAAGPDRAKDAEGRAQGTVVEVEARTADADDTSLDAGAGSEARRWRRR